MEFIPLSEQPLFSNLRTSDAWYRAIYPSQEIVILDPDGWDRQNYPFSYFEELISLKEFDRRVMSSTCILRLPIMDIIALEEKFVKDYRINPDAYDKTQAERIAEDMGIDAEKAATIARLFKNQKKFSFEMATDEEIGKVEP